MQTTYSENMAIGRRGMKATSQVNENIISRAVENAAGIAASRFVVMGTKPLQQCRLPTAEADILTGVALGFVCLDAAKAPGVNASHYEYDQTQVCGIMRRGVLWVEVEDDSMSAGDPVFIRHTVDTSPLDQLGIASSTDDAKTAQLPGAVFLSAAATVTYGDGSTQLLAVVELSLPGGQRGATGPQGEPGGGN